MIGKTLNDFIEILHLGFDIALSSHDEYIDDVCYELTIKIHVWGLNELDKVLQEYVTN